MAEGWQGWVATHPSPNICLEGSMVTSVSCYFLSAKHCELVSSFGRAREFKRNVEPWDELSLTNYIMD